MKQKLSPWFPPEIKPVRVGLYECVVCRICHKFDGRYWTNKYGERIASDFKWRGLARKP